MPLQQTSGNVTADAYGGGVAAVPNYIEDVFSTWLYSGTGAGSSNLPQTITNGVDLSTKGGLVWIKARNTAGDSNYLFDTSRTAGYRIQSNQTDAQAYNSDTLTSFNTTGFTLGTDATIGGVNYSSSRNYASWTFREQAKFFDVVTYTGTGANRTITHNLGSVPGCIIVKRTDTTGDWQVYHSSLANTQYMVLNTTAAVATGATRWNSTTPTSSVFSVGTDATVNASGGTYVAYVFASNAGGFGLTGTDNVISCGSWTSTGSEVSVTLGYEPQWLLYKRASGGTGNWAIADNMRGVPTGSASSLLNANTTAAEAAGTNITFSATGFSMSVGTAGDVWIYIAIRRGPMKVPTDGTKVFSPNNAATGAARIATTGFPVDMIMDTPRTTSGFGTYVGSRLTGANALVTSSTAAESVGAFNPDIFQSNTTVGGGIGAYPEIYWNFGRAPSFFDEVCYTGTGSDITLNHNLTVAPELVIVKLRSTNPGAPLNYWVVGSGFTSTNFTRNWLNLTNAGTSYLYTNAAGFAGQPTSSTIQVSSGWAQSGYTYVSYLFATCPGVSKVGTYTGNGTTQAIACGFTGGARFVLIKRTDSTGDWYVYDTARGMTVLTDPYLLLNSTAAETATLGSVITSTGGFTVNAAILAAINTNGASYLYLAIA